LHKLPLDRILLRRQTREAEAVLKEAASDPPGARKRIQTFQPGHGRSGLVACDFAAPVGDLANDKKGSGAVPLKCREIG
jgi:hypothetical protein